MIRIWHCVILSLALFSKFLPKFKAIEGGNLSVFVSLPSKNGNCRETQGRLACSREMKERVSVEVEQLEGKNLFTLTQPEWACASGQGAKMTLALCSLGLGPTALA